MVLMGYFLSHMEDLEYVHISSLVVQVDGVKFETQNS